MENAEGWMLWIFNPVLAVKLHKLQKFYNRKHAYFLILFLTSFDFFIYLFFFLEGYGYIVQTGLKLSMKPRLASNSVTGLLQPAQGWDSRCMPQHPVMSIFVYQYITT